MPKQNMPELIKIMDDIYRYCKLQEDKFSPRFVLMAIDMTKQCLEQDLE